MKRLSLLGWVLGLVIFSGVTAWAVTRINGNQLIEGTGEFGFARRTEKGTAALQPRLIYSVGQGVMARGELPDSATGPRMALTIGYGLGYDIAHYIVCPIGMTGDLNVDGLITASDLIQLVQFIYNYGASPMPCAAVGDVNCTGNVTSSDAMVLVNFLFKSGPQPCNVCALIPDSWPCQ
jgi:hypothetical protein